MGATVATAAGVCAWRGLTGAIGGVCAILVTGAGVFLVGLGLEA